MKMSYVLLLTHLYFFYDKGCVYNIHIHTSPIVLHDFFLLRISFLNFGEHSHYIKNDPKYNSNDKSTIIETLSLLIKETVSNNLY